MQIDSDWPLARDWHLPKCKPGDRSFCPGVVAHDSPCIDCTVGAAKPWGSAKEGFQLAFLNNIDLSFWSRWSNCHLCVLDNL